MNYEIVARDIKKFIGDHTRDFNGGVLGLSGGLDSTVVAYLAVDEIGNKRVYGVVMPYGDRRSEDFEDAMYVAGLLGIGCETHDIKPVVDLFDSFLDLEGTALENIQARTRMCILYGISNKKNMIVLGTGNKSELETGYFTKYGDGGVDILPLGDLYKTEVRELAEFIGVPKKIIEKIPSAGLRDYQTDEEDLGMSYEILDNVLKKQIARESWNKKVKKLKEKAAHKLKTPPIAFLER